MGWLKFVCSDAFLLMSNYDGLLLFIKLFVYYVEGVKCCISV